MHSLTSRMTVALQAHGYEMRNGVCILPLAKRKQIVCIWGWSYYILKNKINQLIIDFLVLKCSYTLIYYKLTGFFDLFLAICLRSLSLKMSKLLVMLQADLPCSFLNSFLAPKEWKFCKRKVLHKLSIYEIIFNWRQDARLLGWAPGLKTIQRNIRDLSKEKDRVL